MGKEIKIAVNADRLSEVMKRKGITQKKLAEHLGVNYRGFNMRLNDGRFSKVELNLICSTLNCDPEYIQGTIDQDNGYKAYQDRNWKAGLDAAKAAFQAWEQNRPRISVSMDYNNGMKSYYLTCDRAPLEAVLTAIIQAGGYNELQANLQPLTADNVKALEAAPKIYD